MMNYGACKLLGCVGSLAFCSLVWGSEDGGEAVSFVGSYESLEAHETPEWFKDAKLGIFVHWGLYSVPAWAPLGTEAESMEGVEWFRHNPYAEWYLNSLRLGDTPTRRHHDATYGSDYDYYRFGPIFNEAVARWDPVEMAEVFGKTHARYVVLTTKHHDGFPMWTSSIVNEHLPEGARLPSRDIVGEMTEAVRARGMRMGLYYSGGIDWSFHPVVIDGTQSGLEVTPPGSDYADYADGHLRELIERYEPAVLWNDIRYPGGSDIQRVLAEYYNEFPDGVVNDRWGSSVKVPADFVTKEYKKFETIQELPWEANRGIGASFGFNANEGVDDYISDGALIDLLVDVVSKNGNLLLNVGPRPDGSIPEIQKERLATLGSWLDVNGESIFGTRPWRIAESEIAGSDGTIHYTYNEATDTLFVFFDASGAKGELHLPLVGVGAGAQVELLVEGGSRSLGWKEEREGLSITLPEDVASEFASVLRITAASSLEVFEADWK